MARATDETDRRRLVTEALTPTERCIAFVLRETTSTTTTMSASSSASESVSLRERERRKREEGTGRPSDVACVHDVRRSGNHIGKEMKSKNEKRRGEREGENVRMRNAG